MNKTIFKMLATGIILGVGIGVITSYVFNQSVHDASGHSELSATTANEPLYWVAPMDPNFKRDQPGKSPMGMDLVPVYAEQSSQDSPGTVSIDPVMVQNLGVKTSVVEHVKPELHIRTFGEVVVAQEHVVHIHPRVAGWIESLYVQSQGDFIERGEVLYSLYSPELVNAQEELLIALSQGEQQLVSAAKAKLLALNAPQNLIDNIEQNQQVVRTVNYYAPQSGFVSELNIQKGFYVRPNTTLLALANLDEIWVHADISVSEASQVAVGQEATIFNEYHPNHTFSASLDYVYPDVDSHTRTVKARFILDNSALALKPGMLVDVKINTFANAASNMVHQEAMVLAVPKQAVIRTGELSRVVLALGEGKFKSVAVSLGRSFDDVFEVLSGVEAGEEIVVSAQFLIDSESSITSDFMRIDAAMQHSHGDHSQHLVQDKAKPTSVSAWTLATINDVMVEQRLVNLTHGPLKEFNMMGMTMHFLVADNIDITKLQVGQQVHVEVVKSDSGMYEVKTVHVMKDQQEQHHNHKQGTQMKHMPPGATRL